MYNFPDDHDWGQKRAAYFKSPYQDYLSYKDPLDYDETENNAISLQSDSLNPTRIYHSDLPPTFTGNTISH